MWIRPCTMTASRIETYLPCEGPETHHKEKPSLFQQGIYSSLSTSRGAGNNSNNCYFGKSIFMYSYLSTSRGDGNMKSSPSFASNFFSIDTYLPREGPENFSLINMVFFLKKLYLLKRGRKRENKSVHFRHTFACIVTYLPREGPDTVQRCPFQPFHCRHSPLSTSRGAGNLRRTISNSLQHSV